MTDDSLDDNVEPIRLVNRNSELDRFDDLDGADDDTIPSLIRGLIHNRQVSHADDDEAEHLVRSLKFTREKIPRRSLSDLDNFSEYDVDRAQRIIDILLDEELDDDEYEALEFQIKSWDTISQLDQERREEGAHRGANLSAPTGFGKTWAFMGPIYDKVLNDDEFSTAILVFPRSALLRDQLSDILQRLVTSKQNGEDDNAFSVGAWISGLPWDRSEVTNTRKTGVSTDRSGRTVFTLADYWDNESDEDHLYISADRDELFNDDVTLSLDEFLFAKEDIKEKPPDILLTTIESLENFSLKPHYNIWESTDALVIDEVHQYNGLQGSHAANVIDNLKSIRDDSLLFLGVSATLENPESFGRKLFGLPRDEQFEAIEPGESDYDEDAEDYRNHYFMLSREDGAGAASMYIQQMMLLGHSMLDPPQTGDAGELAKILSFIDSKSQIHQRGDQFRDADDNDELWRYHDSADDQFVEGDPNDDYRSVAEGSGHNFVDRPIEMDAFHADSDTSISDLGDMEIIQSTSSLEVGIDIDGIEVVTQYREPLGGLSSFVQRVGRSGRELDTDAHALTFLSSYAGDSNFYYRADRFLTSEITTPLRTDNEIVNDLHEMPLAYYEELNDLYEENPSTWHVDEEVKMDLFERLFDDRMDIGEFYTFLTDPRDAVMPLTGFRTSSDSLFRLQGISDLRSDIDQEEEGLEEEIEQIRALIGAETDEVIQGDNPVNGLLDRVENKALNILALVEESVEQDDGESEEILKTVEETRGEIEDVETREPEDRLSAYETVTGKLMVLQGNLSQHEGTLPDTEPIQEITNSLENLKTAVEEGTIERQRTQRKILHYLRRSTEQVEEYVDSPTRYPHGSLYWVKYLLRAAYFFDQCLRLHDDQSATGLKYYPDNYFGGGGKTFSLDPENRHESESEKPIDRVINQYAPFKAEYLSRTGEMQVFVPDTRQKDEKVVMDFSSLQGRREDEIKIPEKIEMRAINDQTGARSQGIVVYDPVTYQIFPDYDSVPPRYSSTRGKVHSEPHVFTRMEFQEDPDQIDNLSMADVTAKAGLDGVTLEISSTYYDEENDEIRFTGDTERQHLESTDPKLGFVLDTRGISWDLTEFVTEVEARREDISQFKLLEEITLEEVSLNTAAHFLSLLVADVSGVNPEELLHGINAEQEEGEKSVFVFERTEGGQGVVDLFFETLKNRPDEVLRSMLRLLYNSQIELEGLCASEEFVREIQNIDASDREARQTLIEDLTGNSLEPVVQRISEELLSMTHKVNDIQEETGAEINQIYELKHQLAQERMSGTAVDEIPDDLYNGFEDITNEASQEYIEELLVTPDADGCAANLHMNTTLFNLEQSESLSYVALKELRDRSLDRQPSDEDAEAIIERGQLWGGEDDDEVIFPTF